MSRILLLETSTVICSVGLSVDGKLVALRESGDQQSHSELLTTYISEVFNEAGMAFGDLDAVAVSKGPGSYTGLRIGVSTAKGICYAKDIPLLAVDTLQAMANGMKELITDPLEAEEHFFCPMIDARRMEVYLSVFDTQLRHLEPVHAQIIQDNSMDYWFENGVVWFAGDGAQKCMDLWSNRPNARFLKESLPSAQWMISLAWTDFQAGRFVDVAYFEPFYLKDFVAGIPKVKGLYA